MFPNDHQGVEFVRRNDSRRFQDFARLRFAPA
jgi:hypothetical protein